MSILPSRNNRRAGFSLAEMLVAIAIIMVLMTLSAAAILKFRETGPAQATNTNLSKLKSALDTQWQAVRDKAQREQIPTSFPVGANTIQTRDNYVAAKLAQAFPISFVEVFPSTTPAVGVWPAYAQFLGTLGVNAGNAASVSADLQQAVCLMMILERGPSNPGLTPDKLSTSLAVPLAVGTGRPYGCVDAWGRPLLFSRNYRGANNTIGIVSMGANGKAGVQVNVGNATLHTLAVTDVALANDNIGIPD